MNAYIESEAGRLWNAALDDERRRMERRAAPREWGRRAPDPQLSPLAAFRIEGAVFHAPHRPDLGTFDRSRVRFCPCHHRGRCLSCHGSGLLYGTHERHWRYTDPIAVRLLEVPAARGPR